MESDSLNNAQNPRVLVVVEPHPEGGRLLRLAKRKAQSTGAKWEAVFVETKFMQRVLREEEREHFLQLMALAEQMGATVSYKRVKDVTQAVSETVDTKKQKRKHFSEVIVGISKKPHRWSLKPPLEKRLRAILKPECKLVVAPLEKTSTSSPALAYLRVNLQEIFISLLVVVSATAVIEFIDYVWPAALTSQHRNKAIIYMAACALASLRYGLLAGTVAAVASFLALSLYVAPYFSIAINDPSDIASLILFLLAAVIIAFVSNSEYRKRESCECRTERLQSLLRVHRVTLSENTLESAIQTLDTELKKLLGTDMAFFLPSLLQPGRVDSLFRTDLSLSPAELKALEVCWQENKATGVGAPYNPGCKWRFEPMLTAEREIGVLGVRISRSVHLDVAFTHLLASIADQTALILERLETKLLAEESQLQTEREKLRAMILSSVSHDLKTPLASIIGSLSVYRSMKESLPEDQRTTLINTAIEEAQRLDSFITNILDMTRIESGQITLKKEWIKPEEWIKATKKRLHERLATHPITVVSSEGCIEVLMDGLMTGQVLQNLLDNAVKYTPASTPIKIILSANKEGFTCTIHDGGEGIPEDQLEKVFDKYARLKRQDSQVAGTGLGLAIAKAILQAQDGDITASNHPEGGAVFTLTLPTWRFCSDVERKVA